MKPRCTASTPLAPQLRAMISRRLGDPVPDLIAHCSLDEHTDGHHFAAFDTLDQDPALWIRWHNTETALAELPDCPARGPASAPVPEACALFTGHPGPHTWSTRPASRSGP
ncbi:hypothetical protein [Streptomyces sp. CC208A]|uniref:hypothetical protein n=1 Tax=Streptomyces sp. CC208A TaxID=3044573 RepID=UPI0024A81CB2|nr:hypothetical protein [Streptomyces sp. CC208A]